MVEPWERQGLPGPACELWVPGELAGRFPRPPDQSAVFAEALLAGVTPRQDTRLDRAEFRGERWGRGGVLERISPQTCARTKGAGFEASSG